MCSSWIDIAAAAAFVAVVVVGGEMKHEYLVKVTTGFPSVVAEDCLGILDDHIAVAVGMADAAIAYDRDIVVVVVVVVAVVGAADTHDPDTDCNLEYVALTVL
jgi:hypothetical protein